MNDYMNDYRQRLREYLNRYNLTLAEFCEWSGLPFRGIVDGRQKYAQQVHIYLLQRHPLTTPSIPEDLAERIESFRHSRNLTYRELEQRWGVNEPALASWRAHLPSPRQWRLFCAGSGYADIMQPLPKKAAMPHDTLPNSDPALRGGQRFVWRGLHVYHPRHGWGTAKAVVDNWATVQCQDGIERYYLVSDQQAKKIQSELESI